MAPAHRSVFVTAALVAACNTEPTADVGGLTQISGETTAVDTSAAVETTAPASSEGSPADTSGSSGSSSSTEDTGAGPLLDVGSDETGVISDDCLDAPDDIHVMLGGSPGDPAEIWSFDAAAVSFAQVATIDCPELDSALSIDSFSIDRNTDVWLLSRHPEDPQLPGAWPMQISRHTPGSGTCDIVWYGALPEQADCGDMAFTSTFDDADHERLFVHRCTGGGFSIDAMSAPRLFRIDPQQDMPAPIALGNDTLSSAPIAGTGDGRIYGVASEVLDPDTTIIVELDQETGLVTSTLPAPGLNLGVNAGQLALAFYAGDLYVFGIDDAPDAMPVPTELIVSRFDLDDSDGNGEHDIEPLVVAQPLPFASWTLVAAASPTCIPLGPEG